MCVEGGMMGDESSLQCSLERIFVMESQRGEDSLCAYIQSWNRQQRCLSGLYHFMQRWGATQEVEEWKGRHET